MKKFEGGWHIQPFNEDSIRGRDQKQLSIPNPLTALNSKVSLARNKVLLGPL